ncbi:amino acid permease [Candidatus Giovannonibacteria bacterium]|nr:amino acid permease [Candidatus Giovannonibacteria bacterium]
MRVFKSSFWEAVGLIGGMIIGSGMFALPYAISVSGFWSSLAAAVLALFAVLSVHLAYGEIISNTSGSHRLPGYARIYLGNWAGHFEKFTGIFGFSAALLIYGALGGSFLSMLFGFSPLFWTVVFFAAGGVILLSWNIENIGFLNLVLTIFLILAILVISGLAAKSGFGKNDVIFLGSDPFFVFGIFLFSLTGLSVIADARNLFPGKKDGLFKKAILLGTVVPAALYLIFIVSVLMASGMPSIESLAGLASQMGGAWVISLGAFIGVLAMFTSYLALGFDLKEIYRLDIGMKELMAWLFTVLVPLAVFLLGADDFVKLISIVGGLFIAFDGLFVIFILRSLRKRFGRTERFLSFGLVSQILLSIIFGASIIYELLYQVF